MKTKITYSLLAAAAACSVANAQTTAYTTPVGYYNYDAKAGGNLFVPALVEASAFAGAITASSSNTITVSSEAITANAFDAANGYATHYVEITQAGSNQGVVIDIASNTNSVITLASDISALNLAGTETISVRPHVTLKSSLAGAESMLVDYNDSATFYKSDGSIATFYYIGGGDWSSDFATVDGNNFPIVPGTGFVLNVGADVALTVSGEVKESATVVQLKGGIVNVVGPVNPLVGSSDQIANLGFANLEAYADSLTMYTQGDLGIVGTYYSLGDGTVSLDFSSPSQDTFAFTTGGVITASADTSLRIFSGL